MNETILPVGHIDQLSAAKAERSNAVASILVTTAAGNTFDGDEASQGRMARAIAAMEDGESMPWVMANNTVTVVTRAELREALRLAGAEMADLWVKPYMQGG